MAKNKLDAIKKRLNTQVDTLTTWGLSREDALKQVAWKLKGTETLDNINKLRETPTTPTTPTEEVNQTPITNGIQKPETTVTAPTETEEQRTLREQVAQKVASEKSREQLLIEQRNAEGRWDLVEQWNLFRQEAANVQEDLANISAWLKAEGWAITNIAASRIREARSAPLRDQLTSLVKGQELTSASLKELDSSIDAILEARALDRQDEVTKLSTQIESSNLTTEQKNTLLSQLWVQTARMKREEENEAFRQKEQIKADIARADEESIAKTGLTAEQNLQAANIIQDFDVKEDSIAWQSIRKLLKEGKTPEQINQILWLSTDSTWKIDDEQFTRQEKLRKEFESSASVKNYLEATQQFASVVSSLWQESWPWDMAAVFSFMKTLDPSSVVRETEFAAAANSSGILDKAQSLQLLKKAETWEILTPKQRQQFVQIAKALFENRKSAFDERASRFITLSKEAWANPRSVVLDFDNIPWFASNLTEDDLAPIWANSSDEEVLNYLNNSSNFSQYNAENIDNASDDEINSLLWGFNSADQTAWPKDLTSFIKSKEGFRAEAYLDSAWVPTIWYWATKINGQPVKLWDTITEQEADKVFQEDLKRHSNFTKLVTVPLSEAQKTALASFEFNLWPNIWKSTWKSIIDDINNGNIDRAVKTLMAHNKARNPKTWELQVIRGLQNRRAEEGNLLKINT